jgi:hypothetical protein
MLLFAPPPAAAGGWGGGGGGGLTLTGLKEKSGRGAGAGKMIYVATMRNRITWSKIAPKRNPELISQSLNFWEREDDLEKGVLGLAVIGNCCSCGGKPIPRKGLYLRSLI